MAQLKMYRLPGAPYKQGKLPEGFSVSKYKGEEDKQAWADCCKNGLVSDSAGPAQFDKSILSREGLNPFEDVFFIDYKGEHVGTVTAYIHPDDGTGDMHMVGIRKEYRGIGLSNVLTAITVEHLDSRVPYTHLTTDDWRKPAIKGYLSGGFMPVLSEKWMKRRWQSIATQFGFEELKTLKNDATPGQTLKKRDVLRFGAIGRGTAEIIENYCKNHNDASLDWIYSPDGENGAVRDFDAFMAKEFDCLILEGGTMLSVEAMKTGLNVISTGKIELTENGQAVFDREVFLRGQVYKNIPDTTAPDKDIEAFIQKCKTPFRD